MSRLLLLGLSVVALGCASSDGQRAPSDDPGAEMGDEIAGGSTGDFTGDQGGCAATSEVGLGDDSLLGFPGQQLLDFAVGRYEIAIRWGSACDARCNSEAACEPPPDTTGLVGTETTFSLEVEPRGDGVVVTHPTDAQPSCAQSMSVPVRVRLSSADGALLDEVFEAEVRSELGNTADISLSAPVSSLNGTLADSEVGLSQDAELQLQFGFYGNEFWLETYVRDPALSATRQPSYVLTDLLQPADECLLSLPRADVDLTDPGRPAPPAPPAAEQSSSDR
jgi:hypothetical protein